MIVVSDKDDDKSESSQKDHVFEEKPEILKEEEELEKELKINRQVTLLKLKTLNQEDVVEQDEEVFFFFLIENG